MKNLQNLKGVKALSTQEQQSIIGGDHLTDPQINCETHGGTWTCVGMSTCGCVYGPIDPPKEQ